MKKLHDSLIVIDGHCDTVLLAAGIGYKSETTEPLDLNIKNGRGHMDFPRLLEGGVTGQFFAMFCDDAFVAEARTHTHHLLDVMDASLAGSDKAFLASKAEDAVRAKQEGKVAAFLSIEGGEAIGESLDELRAFYRRGIRLMGLTWNRINAIARGADHPGSDGITSFGRKVVAEMEKLGMIVDVSHLCDQALSELLELAERPVVASHSNSRSVRDHRRNLTDAQAEAIAAKGGLIGVTFAGLFVDADPAKVSVARVADHIDRLVKVAGSEHVGMGSDFDGFTAPYGLVMPDCSHMGLVSSELEKRGYKAGDISKIMGGNWLRVMGEVL